MIDTKELRPAVKSAGLNAISREEVLELIDRLEAAEKECDALRAALRHEADCVEAAKAEIEALRAKIAEMEKQEPSHWGCTVLQSDGRWKEEVSREAPPEGYFSIRDIFPLYSLPGAQTQPAPSLPDGWKLVPIEPTIHMCIQGDNARENIDDCTRTPAIYRAMLEAAPEAKP